MHTLTEHLHALLDLLAPRMCIGCGDEQLFSDEPFCDVCEALLDSCSPAWQPPAPSAALFAYGGPVADAIRLAKFGARPDVAVSLGRMMARRVTTAYAGRVDRLVPVPLHGKRLRERGYNVAALMAGPLGRSLAIPVDHRLSRRRETPAQASLDRRHRAANMRGAFSFNDSSGRAPLGRVLLLDDVRTSGATLLSASEVLYHHGASSVMSLCFARTELE